MCKVYSVGNKVKGYRVKETGADASTPHKDYPHSMITNFPVFSV